MVLLPAEDLKSEVLGSVSLTCGTINQGNSYLLDKLLTTKYPLGVVLVEVACQLGLRNASIRANWMPRLQNEEAYSLTNSDFRHFSPDKRIVVELDKLEFVVLNDLFAVGEEYVTELAMLKAKTKRDAQGPGSAPLKRRKKGVPMREEQPWQEWG